MRSAGVVGREYKSGLLPEQISRLVGLGEIQNYSRKVSDFSTGVIPWFSSFSA